MDKREALALADRFREVLERRGIRVERLILYGSFARGTAGKASDIDLIVLSDDFKEKGYWERLDILTDAIYEMFAPIEALAFTPEEWERGDSLIMDYARDGEVVYAA